MTPAKRCAQIFPAVLCLVAIASGCQVQSPPKKEKTQATKSALPAKNKKPEKENVAGYSGTPGELDVLSEEFELGGKKLHMLVSGSAVGEPIILLHAARFHAETWRRLGTIRILAERGFRVVAPDLPGHGGSERAEIDLEKFLGEFMTALGFKSAMVIAAPLGARYALALAGLQPTRVKGLVVIAPIVPEEFEWRLKAITAPTLIVWGEKDRVVPAARADELVKMIKNSRKVILPGANHPAYLDRPEEFHAALLEFVASVSKK